MVKVIGRRELIDVATGEVMSAEVIVREGDSDFKKIWISHILEAIDEVGNAKIKVLFYLIDHANSDNIIIGTIDDIAAATGTGSATVARLLKSLQKHNIIKMEHKGVWRLNPAVVFKGGHNRRMDVLIRYQGADTPPASGDPPKGG